MQINTKMLGDILVAEMSGDVDGKTAPGAQAALLALVAQSPRIVLEMSQVVYMSSAGLRMLLSVRRQIGAEGKLVLAALPEQIHDTMSITGFLDFFTVCETLDESLAAFAAEEVQA